MEKLNKKTLSFPAMSFIRGLAALGTVLVLAACGNDGGGGGGGIIVGPNGCTSTCAGITTPIILTTFQSESFPNPEMALTGVQIFGESTAIIPNASGNIYNWYRGPISMQGTLQVRSNIYDRDTWSGMQRSPCYLPAGIYNLQTNIVGQMGMTNMSGSMAGMGTDIFMPSMMTVDGRIEIKIEAPSPMGLLNQGSRLWAKVSVVRANGVACSPQFFGEFN